MAFVQYHQQPELRSPLVIAAFAGWNDAADSATTAVKFLIEKWKPVKLADIDAEDFYVFTDTRPTIKFVGGVQRTIVWPTNQFLAHSTPSLDRDVILYLGVEPQLKWKTFAESFLEVFTHFNASALLLLGALLADIPHSIAVPISGSSSNADLLERLHDLDVRSSRYEGPTGMIGVLHDACRHADIPVSSLWAAAPHYLAATPNIKVTAALLTYLNTFLSLDLDLIEIQSDAVRFEEQITSLIARDPEASAYVRKLEEQIADSINDDSEDEESDVDKDGDDAVSNNPDKVVSTGPLPSADTLIRSVEELLRQERENNQQNPDNNEDAE